MMPIDTAPKDGTIVRLIRGDVTALCSYWTRQRCVAEYGGRYSKYRSGWYYVSDDTEEFESPEGWEPEAGK
jgi:hypothetical protein